TPGSRERRAGCRAGPDGAGRRALPLMDAPGGACRAAAGKGDGSTLCVNRRRPAADGGLAAGVIHPGRSVLLLPVSVASPHPLSLHLADALFSFHLRGDLLDPDRGPGLAGRRPLVREAESIPSVASPVIAIGPAAILQP